MPQTFTAACLQLTSRREVEDNLPIIRDLARRARADGADLILTPENTGFMAMGRKNLMARAEAEDENRPLAALRDLAAETGAWLLVGSLAVKLADDARVANRSYLIDPAGTVVAWYDKIHMFDVDLDGGESYRESNSFRPGDRAVVADLPWGRLGMTVCYDLRFPQLYRALAQAGAHFLAVPSAFTRQTGRAHWHTLLQARAIETGCFVLAPAQCGDHEDGRQTFGHSLIVAPWGEVLADGGEGVGIVRAEIDPARVAQARGRIASLRHDRDFAPPASH
ncbi:MAG: carbon-nitrogen hydrolase family protein [Hyphomicrobiales bacterium]|nr:carbon-nitrogen hydrolase family protein [Hyphomicrobiales bacterium]MCP5370698.1 carbon-nitrogen hydrolase family protein [Hyphomicrobiales bacterium]